MKRGVDIEVAWLGDTRGVCVCVCDFNGDVFRGVLTTTNVDDTQTLYKNNFHGWLTLCVCVSITQVQ